MTTAEFSVPATPDIAIAFLMSFAGIGFIILSKNVRAKRLVLPPTLLVFGGLCFEIFRRSTNPSAGVLTVAGAGVLVFAIVAYRGTEFCSRCGRTLQDGDGKRLCDGCRTRH